MTVFKKYSYPLFGLCLAVGLSLFRPFIATEIEEATKGNQYGYIDKYRLASLEQEYRKFKNYAIIIAALSIAGAFWIFAKADDGEKPHDGTPPPSEELDTPSYEQV